MSAVLILLAITGFFALAEVLVHTIGGTRLERFLEVILPGPGGGA